MVIGGRYLCVALSGRPMGSRIVDGHRWCDGCRRGRPMGSRSWTATHGGWSPNGLPYFGRPREGSAFLDAHLNAGGSGTWPATAPYLAVHIGRRWSPNVNGGVLPRWAYLAVHVGRGWASRLGEGGGLTWAEVGCHGGLIWPSTLDGVGHPGWARVVAQRGPRWTLNVGGDGGPFLGGHLTAHWPTTRGLSWMATQGDWVPTCLRWRPTRSGGGRSWRRINWAPTCGGRKRAETAKTDIN